MTKPAKHRHEKTDINMRLLAGFAAGILAMMALGLFLMWGAFAVFSDRRAATDTPPPPLADTLPELPPEPRLQVDTTGDLNELRRQEQEVLQGYGWVEREAGIARIPLDRAMEIVAERGLPWWEPEEAELLSEVSAR